MNQIFYVVYCILCYVEYFPRLIKLIKTKSSSDYSKGSTMISLVGMFCWVIYLFSTDQDLILYLGAAVDILLNIVFAFLVFKYYRKETDVKSENS